MQNIPLFNLDNDLKNHPNRASNWRINACGLSLDFCRELISDNDYHNLFVKLGNWQSKRDALFRGDIVNISEQRSASHVFMRSNKQGNFIPEEFRTNTISKDFFAEISKEQQRQRDFVNKISQSEYTELIHIGIGGSDLGPRLLCQALGKNPADNRYKINFIASVDAHALQQILSQASAKNTLVFIASKTFTTQETMQNAQIVRSWLVNNGGNSEKQCIALTANSTAAENWGIAKDNIFSFFTSLGGRYSLWSSISLVARIYCGNSAFEQLLEGAAALDQHFCSATAEENLPVVSALFDYWNRINLNIPTKMLAAYDSRLAMLVPYLQQLFMESLGKQVDYTGIKLNTPSSPILWGDIGTNCQHAFFQQLHQGDQTVACEFVGVLQADHPYQMSHQANLANLLSQAEALSHGYSTNEILNNNKNLTINQAEERVCRGNHPVSILWLKKLDAYHLGALLAFWEHRTFILAHLLKINPFDQWGVERGKMIANKLLPLLQNDQEILPSDLQLETAASIKFIRENSL